tara:strand:+ start:773 stop:1036 length:264 start_codon:yes stop_codon:yes gene_type:complete
MGNILDEYFKDEKDLENYVENSLKEQDQAIMRLSRQRKMVSNALDSLSALKVNYSSSIGKKEHREINRVVDRLREWLLDIDKLLEVI